MTAIDANKCVYDGYDWAGLEKYRTIPRGGRGPYGDFYNVEVIGNIIDNPELVKVKEDYSKSFLPKDANRKIDNNDIDLEF